MTSDIENTTLEIGVCYRSGGKHNYIDLEVRIDCPACPVDKDPETLEISYESYEDTIATCPGCGYTAIVTVEEGVKR